MPEAINKNRIREGFILNMKNDIITPELSSKTPY